MPSSHAAAELAPDLVKARQPLRHQVALRLVDAAILLFRVIAVLALLSPLLGLAILLD